MSVAAIGFAAWLNTSIASPTATVGDASHDLPIGPQSLGTAESTSRVRVQVDEVGREIPPDFLGFSYEAPVLTDDHFQIRNGALAKLLSTLGRGTLRYGAHSVEYTAWSRTARPRQSDERGVLTPTALDQLFDFAKAIGWRVILGLNLAHGEPTVAADEATYAVARGSSRLLALEIGNEPDLYVQIFRLRPQSWSYQDFKGEFDTYIRAIRNRASRAPIAGPGTARDIIAGAPLVGSFLDSGPAWFPDFVKDEGAALIFATHHLYPMIAGAGIPAESIRYPRISNMLSPTLMQHVGEQVHQLASQAAASHLPLRITETNSAARGGENGVSNVFAAALWGADYAFTLAESGVDGLNFHGGFECRGYTPICRSENSYIPQPLYYGMLLFHAAMPGRIVPVRIQSSTTNLAAHAVMGSDGRLAVVLINKESQQGATIAIEGLDTYQRANILRLEGQALDSASGISFGGRAIGADGSWLQPRGEALQRSSRLFTVNVPAASALLVARSRLKPASSASDRPKPCFERGDIGLISRKAHACRRNGKPGSYTIESCFSKLCRAQRSWTFAADGDSLSSAQRQ